MQLGERYVDDLHSLTHIRTHLLHVAELLDGVSVTLFRYIRDLVHLVRHAVRHYHLSLGPVPFLVQAQTVHVLHVVGEVVKGDIHIQLVESVNQHALLVQVGESQRTHQLRHAQLTRPGHDRLKQGA